MASIQSSLLSSILLIATTLLLPSTVLVEGCSCADTGNTPAEQAEYIQGEYGSDLYVIATLTNATSYSTFDDGGGEFEPYEFTFQNTTFDIKDIVFNRDPTAKLPFTAIQSVNGTRLVYETTTETTCCLCGLSFSTQDIGKDFLLPVAPWGLTVCDISCKIENEWCSDIVEELKKGDNVEEMESTATKSTTTTTTGITTTESTSTVAEATTTTTVGTTDAPPTTNDAFQKVDGMPSTTTAATTTTAPETTSTMASTVGTTSIASPTTNDPSELEDPMEDLLASSQEPSPGFKIGGAVAVTSTSLMCSVILLGFGV